MVKIVFGILFIISGVLYFIFLRLLNDPEVEGESGRIPLITYSYSFIPIITGIIILLLKKRRY
jgi:hypothetical protein